MAIAWHLYAHTGIWMTEAGFTGEGNAWLLHQRLRYQDWHTPDLRTCSIPATWHQRLLLTALLLLRRGQDRVHLRRAVGGQQRVLGLQVGNVPFQLQIKSTIR